MMGVGRALLDREAGVVVYTDADGNSVRIPVCEVDEAAQDITATRHLMHGVVQETRCAGRGRRTTEIS